jgi:O-antigen ligase
MIVTGVVIGLLTAAGFFADLLLIPTAGSPFGVDAFAGPGAELEFLGMPGTRNTGFGRYAALAALIALAKLWEGKKRSAFLWCFVPVPLFALVLSQGRTAVIGFMAGMLVLLWMKPGPRMKRWTVAMLGLALLGLTGFYSALWNYLTRGASFDPTLSGRTRTWEEAWNLFQHSPLVGLGFQADRVYLYYLAEAQHAHNVIIQALIQTGLFGTVPLVAALIIAWILALRLYRGESPPEMRRRLFELSSYWNCHSPKQE